MKHNVEDGLETILIPFFGIFPDGANVNQLISWELDRKRKLGIRSEAKACRRQGKGNSNLRTRRIKCDCLTG